MMPSVASLLVSRPKTQAQNVGDVLNFANPDPAEEADRNYRVLKRQYGIPDENPTGPLAPLADMSVYRSLRQMQKGQ